MQPTKPGQKISLLRKITGLGSWWRHLRISLQQCSLLHRNTWGNEPFSDSDYSVFLLSFSFEQVFILRRTTSSYILKLAKTAEPCCLSFLLMLEDGSLQPTRGTQKVSAAHGVCRTPFQCPLFTCRKCCSQCPTTLIRLPRWRQRISLRFFGRQYPGVYCHNHNSAVTAH